jgi:hypothetical protein
VDQLASGLAGDLRLALGRHAQHRHDRAVARPRDVLVGQVRVEVRGHEAGAAKEGGRGVAQRGVAHLRVDAHHHGVGLVGSVDQAHVGGGELVAQRRHADHEGPFAAAHHAGGGLRAGRHHPGLHREAGLAQPSGDLLW